MEQITSIYEITERFPSSEMFGLFSQMRRSSVSIPSNIAEVTSRNSVKELSRFLNIAIGSLFKLETQVFLAKQLNYINENELNNLESKIIELQKKMIFGFKKNIINQSESKNLDSWL